MNGRKVLWVLLIIVVVLIWIYGPTGAGHTFRSWIDGVGAFFTGLKA